MLIKNSLVIKALILCTLVFVSCSKEEDKQEEIEAVETVATFQNIKFAVDQDGLDSKRFFSTSSGKSYSFNEIDEAIGATIDLVWYDSSPSNNGFLFWETPNDLFGSHVMPGATATKIENWEPTATVSLYDLVKEDTDLNGVTVQHSNDAMGPIEYPYAVYFENANGKKGIIKMKSNDGEFLTVDIKVAK